MSKCPFRKSTVVITYQWKCNTLSPETTEEYFLDCIGKECVAYKEKWDVQEEKLLGYCEWFRNGVS